jgi:hypothetical protein
MMQKLLIELLVTSFIFAPVAAVASSAPTNGTDFVTRSGPSGSRWFVIPLAPADSRASPLMSQKRNGRLRTCIYAKQPPVIIMADQLCPKSGLVIRIGKLGPEKTLNL